MCNNAIRIAVGLFVAVSLATATGAPRFTLASLSESEAVISVMLPPQSCKHDASAPFFIAFSTLPGKEFSATVTHTDGSRYPLTLHEAGWAGADFLQWCSFAPENSPCADTAQQASVTIRFLTPLYRGISRRQVTFSNGVLRAPLGRPLRKTAVVTSPFSFTIGLRMEVDRDGIYELTVRTLREHGVPTGRIASRTYRLFERDREIPLYIPNEHHAILTDDDRILFYGKQLRLSPGVREQYSATNVYWLAWGDGIGARAVVASGARRVDPTVYTTSRSVAARDYFDTLHLESDNTIMWLGNVADRPPEELTDLPGDAEADFDNWYWGSVGATALSTFTLTVPSPASRGSARIRIGLMGLSSIDSIGDDHRLEVFVNDKPASRNNSAHWDGQRFFVFESDTFTSDNLEHGVNRLTLQTSDFFADRSALNWVEIAYLRGYEAYDDQVLFRNELKYAGKTVEYTLPGFTSDRIELWDVTHNRVFMGMMTERGSGEDRGKQTLIFQDSIASSTVYFAQTTDKRLLPLSLSLDTIRNAWDALDGADYIAISADSFKTDLEPLLLAHRENGLKTAFVAIDDIYNRFSGGVRNPESIRLFLRFLFERLTGRPPRYLLLGGDTTHDLDKNNRARNIVPTHLARIPGWGPGADDGYFATVNGDDLFPDLAIGRFPAQNRAEMRRLVEKTVRYLHGPDRGYWRDNILMLGGGEAIFTQFNDEAASEIVGSRMNIVRMDADPGSRFYKDEFTAPQRIADHLNTGVYLVNFNGHGGGNIWSDNNFFGYKELSLLHNGQWGSGGRLPLVLSFTCLTGFFESSEYRSLGEEFLRAENDGAISFYGASAYTSRSGNLIMNKLMLEEALSGTWQTVGDLIDFCEMSMLVRYKTQYLHLVRQYNLLGDPALPWALTPDTLRFAQSLADSGTRLTLEGTCMPVRKGEVKLSLIADDGTWNRTIVPANDGKFASEFRLKERMRSTAASVRAYAWNDSAEVRGWIPFVKDSLLVNDVRIDPVSPCFDDSVRVSCELVNPPETGQPEVYCLHAQSVQNGAQVTFTGMSMQPDGSGRWVTGGKIALPFGGSVNDRLLLSFRVLAAGTTIQSKVFSFPICGRPDLVFTDKSLRIIWRDDSLRLPAEVLNTGNAASPPFTIAYLWKYPDLPPDTFAVIHTADSLVPGARRTFIISLSDTGGNLAFFAQLNPSTAFPEMMHDNNRLDGQTRVFYRDLQAVADTLSIDGGRLRLSPAGKFDRVHRVFLFEDTVAAPQPLATPSTWISVREAMPPVQWNLTSRPPLPGDDSLLWIGSREGTAGSLPADTVFKKTGFMLFDTAINLWRYFGGADNLAKKGAGTVAVSMTTATRGSFALASIADVALPEVMVSVYGKSLNMPDYTAKDRPFTIFFSDPSGILPQSIELFLNRKRLPASSHAAIPTTGDLRSLSLSAYPQVERRVDSLLVQCTDLAGNFAKRTFAYLPGSDLTIQSFSCHPNPFTARKNGDGSISKVRFAFLLTDVATSATLSIYTVSGKKIRTWRLDELIGYQQVEWDGRDRDGFRIANGTYYAKLVVQNERKKAKKTIRIAKLEGF